MYVAYNNSSNPVNVYSQFLRKASIKWEMAREEALSSIIAQFDGSFGP